MLMFTCLKNVCLFLGIFLLAIVCLAALIVILGTVIYILWNVLIVAGFIGAAIWIIYLVYNYLCTIL